MQPPISLESARQAAAAARGVTPSELLAEQLAVGPARVIAEGRRNLVMRGLPVATIGSDPGRVTAVCAVSAAEHPAVDVLAALASQDPSGVLVIETVDDAFAFEVTAGRLTGARGLGALDQLEPHVAEVHRRHPERFGPAAELGPDAPAWMKVARTFVEERVLDQLQLCRAPGARLTLVRGDVAWMGTRLPPHVGPTLGHVLLENARRIDERAKVNAALGPRDRLVVPLSEPGPRPPSKPAPQQGDAEAWDFFSDPDPAALAEWDDALLVWSLCDGSSSIAEIVDAAMIGEFRALLALRTLVVARHVVLVEPRPSAPPASESGAQVVQLHAIVPGLPTPAPVEPEPETSYSLVLKKPRKRTRPPEPPSPQPPALDLHAPAPRAPAPRAPTPPPPQPPAEALDVAPTPMPAPAVPVAAPAVEREAPVAAATMVAARVLDRALPSATMVMIVLGATGVVATVAAAIALL
ncbi:MAG: hypothetical protein K1X88_08675 [Nannocystaceae bacterium]|nr:hypothetical protein [Nannocystaceae bacterium]